MSSKEYKIMLLGCGGVGKTAIIERFVNGIAYTECCGTIEETHEKVVEVDGKQRPLNILGTGGQEEFSNIRDQYIETFQGFVIVYSIASSCSFLEAESLYELVVRIKGTRDVPIVLVGNKCDLEGFREVSTKQGKELARKINCPFFEASAIGNTRVNDVFAAIVRDMDAHNPSSVPGQGRAAAEPVREPPTKEKKLFKFFKRK